MPCSVPQIFLEVPKECLTCNHEPIHQFNQPWPPTLQLALVVPCREFCAHIQKWQCPFWKSHGYLSRAAPRSQAFCAKERQFSLALHGLEPLSQSFVLVPMCRVILSSMPRRTEGPLTFALDLCEIVLLPPRVSQCLWLTSISRSLEENEQMPPMNSHNILPSPIFLSVF